MARRVVTLTWDPATVYGGWLVSEHFPCFTDVVTNAFRLEEIVEYMGGAQIEPVPVPHDCTDGGPCLEEGVRRLAADLESGV